METMAVSRITIVGGGHNGLTCAFYLARARHQVSLFERRGVVGGAAVTEELHPGFRNSVASYAISLLNPKVIRDMELARHGLTVKIRPLSYFPPAENGDDLIVDKEAQRTHREVSRWPPSDADRLAEFHTRLDRLVDFVRGILLRDAAQSRRQVARPARRRRHSALPTVTNRGP
jgi:phytoene dehydrogenase-like protein